MMNFNRRPVLPALVAVIGLSACASLQPGSPEWVAAEQQKQQEARADAIKDSISDAPDWFVTPRTDKTSLYEPGTAMSSDMQFAVDKAVLAAKRSLADRVNSKLSSKMKEFVSEAGATEDAVLMTESERVTKNLITEVNLSGFNVAEKKLVPSGTQYRAFVLVQYPLGNANRILLDQIKKDTVLETRLRATEGYKELDKDVETAKNSNEPPPPAAAPEPKVQAEANP